MANRVVEFPVPFALRKILADKSTGELLVRGENFERSLFVAEGNLVFAKTNVLHERLGEVLFKLGKINQTQFWDVHKLLEGKRERVGKVLVDSQFISPKDLNFGLIYQVRTIALSLFMLTSGEWSFRSRIPDLPDDCRFNVPLSGIIVEGVKRFKGLMMFRDRILCSSPVMHPLPSEYREYLTAEELSLHNELASRSNLMLKDIAAQLKLNEESFWTRVALYYFLSVMDVTEGTKVRETENRNIEDLLSLHERLKGGAVDYYQIFGLNNTSSAGDIKTAYFQMAKKFHPDRLGDAPDPELREKANFVFSIINKAYEVLSNEERRREYDMRGYKEVADQSKVSENLAEKANILYRKARTLYNQKRFWEAASLLEEAVRNDPKPPYFMLLGLSQSNLPNLVHSAEKNFLKVIELDRWNAEAFAALGMLFYSQRLLKRAEGFFLKALSINPDHAVARKKLEEINPAALGKREKPSLLSIFGKKKG